MTKVLSNYIFADDGTIPNSLLPVIIYRKVCNTIDNAQWFEHCFQTNNWTNNWRDIVLPYDHFHSITHEVLGVSKGSVSLRIGGQKNGKIFEVSAGDVLILPAGVGHFALSNHKNYEITGGYPEGKSWDMMTGTPEERKAAFRNIASLTIPTTDPVFGSNGGLIDLWK